MPTTTRNCQAPHRASFAGPTGQAAVPRWIIWGAVAVGAYWLTGTFSPAPIAAQATSGRSATTSDQQITTKIRAELQQDPGVRSEQVTVQVDDGAATLSGEVTNVLAKDRAGRVAEIVPGVRSVANRIQVLPSSERSDEQILEDVQQALADDPATNAQRIVANVEHGTVSLTGNVSSYQQRDLVRNAAKGVRGVKDLLDQMVIKYDDERSDGVIQQEIARALHWDVLVDNSDIDVAVDNGHVELAGTVDDATAKRRAQAIAWVAGTQGVDASQLAIKQPTGERQVRPASASAEPAELREAVKRALLYDPRLTTLRIDVQVADGVVTLRGAVNSLKAKRAAEQDVRRTIGVVDVQNELTVRTGEVVTDERLASRVQAALLRNPYVERFDITVTVVDGQVQLFGNVDSAFEKEVADDVASRVTGVVDVRNQLDVTQSEGAVQETQSP